MNRYQTKNAIILFNNTITNLKHNQLRIQSRIIQISQFITESVKHQSTMRDIIFLSTVYSQLTNSLMIIEYYPISDHP